MVDNPYEPPSAEPTEADEPKHRSFRLTPGSKLPDASVTVGTFRDALIFTLIQQLPLLVLTALMLDGGIALRRVAVACIAFWIMALVIVVQRGRTLPDLDILLVKWGYLPLLLLTCILWAVAAAIAY